MLSRFSIRNGNGLTKSFRVLYQPSLPINTSTPYEAKESEKRDLVNFPDLVRPEYTPPVRLGFIPESWFNFFYTKTGVTGPYMLGVSVGTYLLSKEIVPVDHNFTEAMALIALMAILTHKYGDKIAQVHNNHIKAEVDAFDQAQEAEKLLLKNQIESAKKAQTTDQFVHEVMAAKKENVMLQMEAGYRIRISEVYKKVKQRLDYFVELQNVEKRITQKNLVDYVMRNVMASITPDLEKSVMQSCINDLNALAAKA